jgi:hypothetical protein
MIVCRISLFVRFFYIHINVIHNMHTIFLQGGLGNQLFMVFTVLGYAMKNNSEFYFEDCDIVPGFRKKTYWESFLKPLKKFKKNIKTKKIIVKEVHHHYMEFPSVPNNLILKLHGYFQSYKYFHDYKDAIFQLIDLNQQKEKLRLKLPQRDWERVISMHFRIGDYKRLSQYHPILPVEYYVKALANFDEDEEWTVLYFCEEADIETVERKVDILKQRFTKMTFERMEEKLEDWEEMLTMSLCRNHIIANSSFSYFGAYFNTRKEVFVYYPSLWFGPKLQHKKTNDMFLPNWIKV